MRPLRFGVLGAARIAESAIVAPARLTGTPLVLVAARDRDRARQFADTHGIERVADSYEAVLEDPEVDAIYNPLPNGLHAPWNLAAVRAGKHVLSEKPFAGNANEAAEVRDAAKDTGVKVGEAFHNAYHPLMDRLHELITRGELGDLEQVEAMVMIPSPGDTDPRWSLELAGGALMDVGCYGLHAYRLLAPYAGGEPELVDARGGERAGAAGVDEWLDADLRFPSGATGNERCHMAGDRVEMSLEVRGTLGTATLPNFVLPHRDDRLIVETGEGRRVEHLGTRPSYAYQLEAFTVHVREGKPFRTDADDAVATMRLVDQCYDAVGLGPRPRATRGVPVGRRDAGSGPRGGHAGRAPGRNGAEVCGAPRPNRYKFRGSGQERPADAQLLLDPVRRNDQRAGQRVEDQVERHHGRRRRLVDVEPVHVDGVHREVVAVVSVPGGRRSAEVALLPHVVAHMERTGGQAPPADSTGVTGQFRDRSVQPDHHPVPPPARRRGIGVEARHDEAPRLVGKALPPQVR